MNPSDQTLTSATGRSGWHPALQLAIQEVFELMLACTLTVPEQSPREDGLDITSMVGMAGPMYGILTMRCSARSAGRMAARMLGIEANPAGPEMWDAVGEICNMIAGNFKNKITSLGDACQLSVPTVITGGDRNLHSRAEEEIHLALLFEGEPVVLSLEIHH